MEDVRKRKAHIRRQMLKKREGLDRDYCENADRGILERVLELEAYRQADVIFAYVSTAGEVDTRKLIDCALEAGKRVAVPKCGLKGIMKAYSISSLKELETGAYGILEPVGSCREVRPEEIGLAVVPCVCCCQSGVRLGYGGGYYDRYLPDTRAVRAALCRERMMAGDIPTEKHDCPMDLVVTEERVLEIQGFGV